MVPWNGGRVADADVSPSSPEYPARSQPILTNWQVLPSSLVTRPGRTIINGGTALSGQLLRMDDYDNGSLHTLMAITHSTLYQIGADELAVVVPGIGGGALTGLGNDPFLSLIHI